MKAGKIERWHLYPDDGFNPEEMMTHPDGEWVKYEDAQAEIHRLIDLLQSAFMDGVDAGMKARENFADTMQWFVQWQKQQEGK